MSSYKERRQEDGRMQGRKKWQAHGIQGCLCLGAAIRTTELQPAPSARHESSARNDIVETCTPYMQELHPHPQPANTLEHPGSWNPRTEGGTSEVYHTGVVNIWRLWRYALCCWHTRSRNFLRLLLGKVGFLQSCLRASFEPTALV